MTRPIFLKSTATASGGIGSLVLIACAATSVCWGQTPQLLAPGTIVTGQCASQGGDPGCVLPNLFGPAGLTVFPNPVVPHYAHFVGAAQTTLNQTLSTAIAT